jgi:hypothetical protein
LPYQSQNTKIASLAIKSCHLVIMELQRIKILCILVQIELIVKSIAKLQCNFVFISYNMP